MKRIISMLLVLCMVLGAFACTKQDNSDEIPKATDKPETSQTQTETKPDESKPTKEPKQEESQLNWCFFLDDGAMKIGFSPDFPGPVELKDGSLRFRDPDKKWTMIFKAATARQIELDVGNYTNLVEGFLSFGYYQNIVAEDREIGGHFARYLSFERNPDWDSKSMGYTTSYTEPHAFYIVDFQDRIIGGAGGVIIDISAPEDTVADLNEILSDKEIGIILSNIVFAEGVTGAETSVPGITATFPIRWSIGNNSKDTACISECGYTADQNSCALAYVRS